ncbi:MAG: hypothetical protein KBC22_00485 [Candidatus Pacebacteria bacterium]|nr:hypothetical protein [Candidatus Paceibacterota bacterium]
MTLKQLVIAYLSSNKASYKKLHGYLSGNQNFKKSSIKPTLFRLRAQGIVTTTNDNQWQLTAEGKELFQKKNKGLRFFFSKKKPHTKPKKEILLLFDIPEKERYKRDWLRSELIGLSFEMIQKSVWLGPKLPEDLHAYLMHKKLIQYIRIFSIKK